MLDTENFSFLRSAGQVVESLIPSPEIISPFTVSFVRENKYYLKNEIVDAMDSSFGDIKNDILDLQKQILISVEEAILHQEVYIYSMASSFSIIDATLSLAKFAIEKRLCRPQLIDDTVLVIKGGRHLLQELTVDAFVPNDIFSSSAKNISIITGPNSSGKSVYLKQIGLITYLAHIGAYVPCERAVIGMTDSIFTRISSEETVSSSQSTFTMDLSQMAKMFRGASRRSLCLIDEFGKGTMPLDGISLLGAVIKHFVGMPCRTFFVLHLMEALDESILSQQFLSRINCFKMEVLSERSGSDDEWADHHDDDDIVPLFKLKVGIDVDSEGLSCAKAMGVNDEVTQRAQLIKQAIKGRADVTIETSLRRISVAEANFLRTIFDGSVIADTDDT